MSEQNGITSIESLKIAESLLQSRSILASHLGKAFGGDRDYYEVLGYKRTPTYLDYLARYHRDDIASRVVNAYPDETWRLKPSIFEDNDENQTRFEVAWDRLSTSLRVFHYLHRLDRLVGLGRYSVMLLGFADNRDLAQPVARGASLRYLSLYSEENAEIESLDEDRLSPRFGLPDAYKIDFGRTNSVHARDRSALHVVPDDTDVVHHERILHVAEDVLEDDVYGTPRLLKVFNRLDDLNKIVGGSAEALWRNGSRAIVAALRDGAHLADSDMSALSDEIDQFIHGMSRALKVKGMDVTELAPEIASPRDTFDIAIAMISAASRIPQRILLGSERGNLASEQDEGNWCNAVQQRQLDFAEPIMLRELIDRLIQIGSLPTPPNGYTVEWQPLFSENANEKAERIEKTARSLSIIAGPGRVLQEFPKEELREILLEWDAVSPFQTDEELAFEEEIDDDDAIEEDEDQ